MLKIARLALLALAISGVHLAWGQNAEKTYQDLIQFRSEILKVARDAKKPLTATELSDKVREKAKELTSGVNFESVEPKECDNWAKVAELLGDDRLVCNLTKKFLTTHPSDKAKFDAMLRMTRSCNNLGEADMVRMNLMDIPVPDSVSSNQLASSTTGRFVDTISEKMGVEVALKTLNDVQAKLVFEDPKAYATRILAEAKAREAANPPKTAPKPDAERLEAYEKSGKSLNDQIKFSFQEKAAELYQQNGQRDKAIATLKDAIAKLPEDSPLVRRANGQLLQMTLVGIPAPAIESGKSYGVYEGLASMKGKVVILDFFAHWCGPCIASFPDMKQMYSELHEKGLEIVGVTTYYGFYKAENSEKRDMNRDTEFSKLGEFLQEHKLPWTVVVGERTNMEEYGVTGIPTAVIIDRLGVVHELHVGYSKESFAEFRKIVEKLLTEKS